MASFCLSRLFQFGKNLFRDKLQQIKLARGWENDWCGRKEEY